MLRVDALLKAIKKQPMTVHDVTQVIGLKYPSARAYLTELHKSGDVHICRFERTTAAFRPVYKYGNEPDAPKPERMPHWFYDMKREKREYKPRKKQSENTTHPRRDVAASWF